MKRIIAGCQRWQTLGFSATHFDIKCTIVCGHGMFETVAIGDTHSIRTTHISRYGKFRALNNDLARRIRRGNCYIFGLSVYPKRGRGICVVGLGRG